MTQAGPAIPVVVSTQPADAGPALRVAVVSDGRPTEGGPARPVVVVTDGRPTQGNAPLPIVVAAGVQATNVLAGPAMAVVVVSGTLGGVAPANTVLPVISGTLAVGALLTTTDGTWTGTAPIVYTYQWKRAGVAIGGATNNTYTVVAADQGTTLTVTVTATNVAGNASATSAGVAIPSMQATLLANATYAWFEGLPGAGNVGTWTDIVAGEVATIVGTASGCVVSTLNGKPAILFNATGNLATAAFAAGAVTQPHIVISVFDWNIATTFRYVHDGTGGANRAALVRDGTPRAMLNAGVALVADTDFTQNPSYAVCTLNGASSSLNLDGVVKTGNAGANTLPGMTIGALSGNTNRFSGTIALIAVVSGANYVARAASILSALQAYYGF